MREIGAHTLRGGSVVGDHTFIFTADGARVVSQQYRVRVELLKMPQEMLLPRQGEKEKFFVAAAKPEHLCGFPHWLLGAAFVGNFLRGKAAWKFGAVDVGRARS